MCKTLVNNDSFFARVANVKFPTVFLENFNPTCVLRTVVYATIGAWVLTSLSIAGADNKSSH